MLKANIKKKQNFKLIEKVAITIIFLMVLNNAFSIFYIVELPKTYYLHLPFGIVEFLLFGLGFYSLIKLFK